MLPMFKEAYARRRCIVPVDGFFEWRAIRGARAKQPYAIAMKDGSPFGLSGTVGELEEPKHRRVGASLVRQMIRRQEQQARNFRADTSRLHTT